MKKQRLVALIVSLVAAFGPLAANGQARADIDGESSAALSALPVGEVSMAGILIDGVGA